MSKNFAELKASVLNSQADNISLSTKFGGSQQPEGTLIFPSGEIEGARGHNRSLMDRRFGNDERIGMASFLNIVDRVGRFHRSYTVPSEHIRGPYPPG